jgi:hypothetical protein
MTDPQEPRVLRVSEPKTGSEAREACLDLYAERYEWFALREQEARGAGNHAIAEGAHRYALWVLRAYEAESR